MKDIQYATLLYWIRVWKRDFQDPINLYGSLYSTAHPVALTAAPLVRSLCICKGWKQYCEFYSEFVL